MSAVTIGTGARSAIFGQENQRAAMSGCAIGVHRLTATMAISTPASAKRPSSRAQSCSGPSVLSTSHPAPSSA